MSTLEILREVVDPEIPALDIVEMGIVRGVRQEAGVVVVQITPTYSGCPAMKQIELEILSALERHGIREARVETVFDRAWSSDCLGDVARQKLKRCGIAPPDRGFDSTRSGAALPIFAPATPVQCPYCNSPNTRLESPFGATACKALYFCAGCQQPFEKFKEI